MTRPDLDALQALLDKATPGHHPLSTAESAAHHMANAKDEIVRAMPDLLAHVRELERERDEALGHAEIWHALSGVRARESGSGYTQGAVEGALDAARRAAALAMRERCAQVCDSHAARALTAQKGDPADPINANLRMMALLPEDCAAAIRALEP